MVELTDAELEMSVQSAVNESVATSEFERFLRERGALKTFFEPLSGNNGDELITMGARHLLSKIDLPLVSTPEEAEQIVINGGGAMVDIWDGAGIKVLEKYRLSFPTTPLIVAPSSFRFNGIDFPGICGLGTSELTVFARESYSLDLLRSLNLPANTTACMSQDLAFELKDSTFLNQHKKDKQAAHVLIALRKDKEGDAGVLVKVKGGWLPGILRKPLSRLRDRLVASRVQGLLDQIISKAGTFDDKPRLYCDVSASVCFQEFVDSIKNAALIVTDRLHVAILGNLLEKQVLLRPGGYHKIRGVYEHSMSGSDSLVTLVD
jgi:exopolysaccharide biosynthesis predicted pyruvyltransferase EpsI